MASGTLPVRATLQELGLIGQDGSSLTHSSLWQKMDPVGWSMSMQRQKGPPLSLLWTMSWSIREYGFSFIPQFLVAGGMQVTDLAYGGISLSFATESSQASLSVHLVF